MDCAFGFGPEALAWMAGTSDHGADGSQAHSSAEVATMTSLVPRSALKNRSHPSLFSSFSDGKEGDEEGEGKKSSACFPAAAKVYVKGRGPVRVSDIQVGEQILAGDAHAGNLNFSPFLGHLHLEAAATCECVELRFANDSTLLVSREHLVFAARSLDDHLVGKKASELRAGDFASRVGVDGILNRARILTVTTGHIKRGRYAPLTRSGTVVVDGTLCSCYADPFAANAPAWWRRVVTHEGMHHTMLPLFIAYDFGLDRAAAVAAAATSIATAKSMKPAKLREGIHPYCRALLALPVPASA